MQPDRFLADAWTAAHDKLALSGDDLVLQELIQAWGGETRFYHGLAHLRRGLQVMAELGCHDGLAELVWFFRDAIYVVGRSDNELNSACWFSSYAEGRGLDAATAQRGARLILMTADHQRAVSDDALWPFLNDTDLSVFATGRPTYDRYADDVWREYQPLVPRAAYVAGRAAFMAAFVSRPIFLNDAMKSKEPIAHKNIAAELDRLRLEHERAD